MVLILLALNAAFGPNKKGVGVGKQGQFVGTPNRVLYGAISNDGGRLWFVCDRTLHTAEGETLVVNQRSIALELPELTLDRLRSLIIRTIAEHHCFKVEVRNFRDEDDQEDRGKVVFFLSDDTTPVDILNLVHATIGLESVAEPEDDLHGKVIKDGFRDACDHLLFTLPPPGKRGKEKLRV